jgi:hypothetical protein
LHRLQGSDGGFDLGNHFGQGNTAHRGDFRQGQRMALRWRQAHKVADQAWVKPPAFADIADGHPRLDGLVTVIGPIERLSDDPPRKKQRQRKGKDNNQPWVARSKVFHRNSLIPRDIPSSVIGTMAPMMPWINRIDWVWPQ